ncbi:hypothetical protein L6452_08166 [Arctium lappa]|uniref:Uncharacterized protein n=1 Tax=Arctium lappa TaxID=4217 RepID=A0ACB9DGJ4_ARCLA|nr:hypothetical protein L6452_08166 [Arctium lappa]
MYTLDCLARRLRTPQNLFGCGGVEMEGWSSIFGNLVVTTAVYLCWWASIYATMMMIWDHLSKMQMLYKEDNLSLEVQIQGRDTEVHDAAERGHQLRGLFNFVEQNWRAASNLVVFLERSSTFEYVMILNM